MTLSITAGIPAANARSYAYDNTNYIQSDPINFSLAAAGSSSFKMTAFIAKQLKSITLVPTAAPTANDQLTLTLQSLYPQVFGTATGGNYIPGGSTTVLGTGTTGTATATGSNTVTLTLNSFGTAPALNPHVDVLSGGTFNVVVANGVGTNTQNGYVFPKGVLGGLSLNPGDVLTVAKGTDTVGAYQCEAELYFTPGSNLTV